MTLPPAPPAGWYPDPEVPGQVRWFDGTAWTAQVAPTGPPPVPPRSNTGKIIGLTLGFLLLLPILFVIGVMALGPIVSQGFSETCSAGTSCE